MPRRYCSLASIGAAIVIYASAGSSWTAAIAARPETATTAAGAVTLASAAGSSTSAASATPANASAEAGATATPEESATKPRTAPAPARIDAGPAKTGDVQLSVSPQKVATGGVGLVTVRGLLTGDEVTGTFAGEAIPFAAGAGTATALFGVDLDVKPQKYMVRVKVMRGGKPIDKSFSVAVFDGKYPEQSFTVPPEKDSNEQDVELGKRIAREAKETSAIWPEWSAQRLWKGGFAQPAKGAMSNFGSKRIINGKPRRPHSGADQKAKTGDPIYAINDGKVVLAADHFFGGQTTVIDHGHGLFSMYMHQSKMDVGVGASVKKGDKVGEVGMTGRATGPHLHWGLRLLGARVDPAKLLALSKELDAIDGVPAQPAASPMTVTTGGGAANGG